MPAPLAFRGFLFHQLSEYLRACGGDWQSHLSFINPFPWRMPVISLSLSLLPPPPLFLPGSLFKKVPTSPPIFFSPFNTQLNTSCDDFLHPISLFCPGFSPVNIPYGWDKGWLPSTLEVLYTIYSKILNFFCPVLWLMFPNFKIKIILSADKYVFFFIFSLLWILIRKRQGKSEWEKRTEGIGEFVLSLSIFPTLCFCPLPLQR